MMANAQLIIPFSLHLLIQSLINQTAQLGMNDIIGIGIIPHVHGQESGKMPVRIDERPGVGSAVPAKFADSTGPPFRQRYAGANTQGIGLPQAAHTVKGTAALRAELIGAP